jgi:hypothetical protein
LVCCLSAVHALAVDGCKSSDGRTFASFSIFQASALRRRKL